MTELNEAERRELGEALEGLLPTWPERHARELAQLIESTVVRIIEGRQSKPPQPLQLDDMIDSLYNLTAAELRLLAWEALLISDGPDRVVDETSNNSGVHVEAYWSSPQAPMFLVHATL